MGVSHRLPVSGRITRGIKPNAFVDETIKFVEYQLHLWRDDDGRPIVEAEEDLNGQLCKYLDDRSRTDFPMACFHHEERQGNRRRVDISVGPSSKAIDATMYDSIYEPFLVIEGKRLPAPSKDREREYVTGLDEFSGGIQRFRLCLHGKLMPIAIMVGYIQDGDVEGWRTAINKWIADLKTSGDDETCKWTNKDLLGGLRDDGKVKASRCESRHTRADGVPELRLVHLWICIPKKSRGKLRRRSTE